MNDTSCPQNQTWVEGKKEALICKAQGNPPPIIECIKEGEPHKPGVLQQVTRDQSGTYICSATNKHGTVTQLVTVYVECEWHLRRVGATRGWGMGSHGIGEPLVLSPVSWRGARGGPRGHVEMSTCGCWAWGLGCP